ncbi:glycoside hydrolase family 36 protein [Actinopolymorpha rutila]|nr:glycoside hydrolase family 36 protein [Actinopolymorpha rutila]
MLVDAAAVLPHLTLLRLGPGTNLSTEPATQVGVPVTLTAPAGTELSVRIEAELGDAVGYWHPGQGSMRTLPADWAGQVVTSLVNSAPMGALYNADAQVLFGWAADRPVDELTIRYGVSEEHKTFAVEFHAAASGEQRLQMVLTAAGGSVAEVVQRLADWMSTQIEAPALSAPKLALEPVYSTWYTFTQDISAEVIESEAALAVPMGCRTVFIDDGWQRLAVGRGYQGCGDWVPDPDKFPDLLAHVRRIRALGAGVVLWVAPLLLGTNSDAYAALAKYATQRRTPDDCFVLDPRHREVREHLADVCLRLVSDYEIDGLKIDFLDTAMRYQGTPPVGDIHDVGEAMAALLGLLRTRLDQAGHGDVVFEFRQPYVSPAIARFGQILRAGDCPADAVVNLRSTIDCRLLSVGQVVHADPMMWSPNGGPEAVAQQIYAGLFSVPQISMRLADLPADQAEALTGLVSWWRDLAPVVLEGSIEVTGTERGYTTVRAVHDALGRAVVGVYAPVVVDLGADLPSEVTLVNATAASSVVVRTHNRSITAGVLRSPSATDVGAVSPSAADLVELPIAPYGSAVLTLS